MPNYSILPKRKNTSVRDVLSLEQVAGISSSLLLLARGSAGRCVTRVRRRSLRPFAGLARSCPFDSRKSTLQKKNFHREGESFSLEQVAGIEPAHRPWQGRV